MKTSLAPRALRRAFRRLLSVALVVAGVVSVSAAPTPVLPPAGAEVECTTPDGHTELITSQNQHGATWLTDDETLTCPLQAGQTTFVIKLPSAAMLERLKFINENTAAAGELNISVSNDQLPAKSEKWIAVDGRIAFKHKRLFNLSMVGVDARYVRLAFDVQDAARLSDNEAPAVSRTLDRSIWKQNVSYQLGLLTNTRRARLSSRSRDYDFAALRAKARIVYVSSGGLVGSPLMIDNRKQTSYRFGARDPHPTAIVELSKDEAIHRVTALYQMHTPGRVEVYLLPDLSERVSDLENRQPVAVATDEKGEGFTALDFDPEGARYVAVRYLPEQSSGEVKPFEIAEIEAFGPMPQAMVDATEAPELFASNGPGSSDPPRNTVEISSTSVGVIAIPPSLPQVSP